MKKVFLFCVLALTFVACKPKTTEPAEAPKADTTIVKDSVPQDTTAKATADTTATPEKK